MNNECSKIEILVSACLDGELSETQVRDVESHLAACPDCRRMLQEFRRVEEAFTSLEPDALEQSRWDRMLWKVSPKSREGLTAGPRRIPMDIRLGGRRRWAAFVAGGLAVAGAVLVAAVLFFAPDSTTPSNPYVLAADNTAKVESLECASTQYDANVRLPRDEQDILVVDLVMSHTMELPETPESPL